MSPVTDVDATAIHFLKDFIDELEGDGAQLALANPSQQVWEEGEEEGRGGGCSSWEVILREEGGMQSWEVILRGEGGVQQLGSLR
jgi:hypothetical protein